MLRGSTTLAEAYFVGRDKPSGAWFEREVGFSAEHAHDMRSISKSVTGLVAGIVQGRGLLSLDQPVLDFSPELADLASATQWQITVRHLLDMTVGWAWNESDVPDTDPANSETQMLLAPDRNRHLLGLPMLFAPGSHWAYRGATALQRLDEDAGRIAQHPRHAQGRVVGLALAQDGVQRVLVDVGRSPACIQQAYQHVHVSLR